jgi:hypothetical protein
LDGVSAYTAYHFAFTAAGGIRFRLTEPLTWRVGAIDGPIIVVDADFVFDVSVPRAFRWLFNPLDRRYLKAAALHDWLLEYGWDRITAGAVFHQALRADGVSAWRRIVMLLAVQLYKFS